MQLTATFFTVSKNDKVYTTL